MDSHDATIHEAAAVVCYADLGARFGITFSKTHLARLEVSGKFPRRFHLTPGRCAWLVGEVRQWLESRIAARDTLPVRPVPPPKSRLVRGRSGGYVKRPKEGVKHGHA